MALVDPPRGSVLRPMPRKVGYWVHRQWPLRAAMLKCARIFLLRRKTPRNGAGQEGTSGRGTVAVRHSVYHGGWPDPGGDSIALLHALDIVRFKRYHPTWRIWEFVIDS